MTGSRRAIVAPIAGTTRDALARPVIWRGSSFQLFDTGGLFGASEDPLHELVVEQGQRAIKGADLLVFLVDGREGLVSGDQQIAKQLRQNGQPVLLAINKTDDKRARGAMDFYRLDRAGLEVSAEHGDGVADLLDVATRCLAQLAARCSLELSDVKKILTTSRERVTSNARCGLRSADRATASHSGESVVREKRVLVNACRARRATRCRAQPGTVVACARSTRPGCGEPDA
jgi:small GTP-binding protein